MSGYLKSGKTTAAKYLCDYYGFQRAPFAAGLKEMLLAIGLTEDHVYGDLKHEPLDLLCGKTPREAMQTLGTEWGRELIGGDLWLRVWQHRLLEFRNNRIIADDLRFSNEVKLLRGLNAKVIRVHRPGCKAGEHASEQINFGHDYYVENDGSFGQLHGQLDDIVREIL